ncbi:hypothetical protein RF55_24374, partial [Lasius niger]
MVNNMVHHTTQTSLPVSPLPPRGKLLPQRESKKVQSKSHSTSKTSERLSPVRRPPIKKQVALLPERSTNLLPAAELIPPGRSKEDVLDELIRDLKILKKQVIEGKKQSGETSRLTPETKTYKGKRKHETEIQQVVVQRSCTSEQDTTEAPNTEDRYPKDGEPWTMVLGRKEKKKKQLLQSQHKQQDGIAAKKISSTMRRPKSTVSPRKEKKTAAVAITTMTDETSYKELMQLAKRNISLEELKIDDIDCRRAMTGGLLLQIHGKDNQSKAEQLTDKLQSL